MDKKFILENINQMSQNTMVDWMDINFVDYDGETLTAEMPVTEKVLQPMRLLHGGATAALAETVGSVITAIDTMQRNMSMVGTHLNIYHLKSAKDGMLTAKGSFIRKGKTIHVVKIDIFNEKNEQISYAILTNKIFKKKEED